MAGLLTVAGLLAAVTRLLTVRLRPGLLAVLLLGLTVLLLAVLLLTVRLRAGLLAVALLLTVSRLLAVACWPYCCCSYCCPCPGVCGEPCCWGGFR